MMERRFRAMRRRPSLVAANLGIMASTALLIAWQLASGLQNTARNPANLLLEFLVFFIVTLGVLVCVAGIVSGLMLTPRRVRRR